MRKKIYSLFILMLVIIFALSAFGPTALADPLNASPGDTSQVSDEPLPSSSPADIVTPTEEPVPSATEEPAPSVTEEPAPSVTEEPVPSVTEEPVPSVTEEPAPSAMEEPAPSPTDTARPSHVSADAILSTSPIRFGAISKTQHDEYYTVNPNMQEDPPEVIMDNRVFSTAESKISSNLLRLTDEKYLPSGTTRDQVIAQMKRTNEVKETGKASGTSVHVYVNLKKGADYDILSPYVTDIEKDESDGFAVGWVDTGSLDELASLDAVKSIEQVTPPIVHTGSIDSEGDSVLKAINMRNATTVDGTGLKIGVISDGVDSLDDSQASGDLPSDVNVLSNTQGGDEGTAMLEIVHDLAPGAELSFHDCGDDIYAFNQAIDDLAADGCDVICDDISWTTEPFFEDGTIAQHVTNLLATSNIVYCTSAGNQAYDHYQGKYQKSKSSYGFANLADLSHGSKKTGPFVWVHVPYGESVYIVLQWNDPSGASSHNYNLYLNKIDDEGHLVPVDWSTNLQSGSQDPIEEIVFTNKDSDYEYEDFAIAVTAADSSAVSAKKTLEMYEYFESGYCFSYANNRVTADSIYGQAAVPGVIACAAMDVYPHEAKAYKNKLEYFSSRGPVTMISGVRKKPDVCGVDGVTITGAGDFGYHNLDYNAYYFFGTSAASPHIAAIAALIKSRFPDMTASQIKSVITGSAVDKGTKGYDYGYGSGLADALAAANYYHKVTVDCQNGSTPTIQLVKNKGLFSYKTPVYSGFNFGGWFTDKSFGSKYYWNVKTCKVTKDITLYAKWVPKTPSITATVTNYKTVTLAWSAIPNVGGYEVWRKPYGASAYKLIGSPDKAGYIDSNVQGQIKYYYIVRAYCIQNGIKIYGSYSGNKYVTPAWPTIKLSAKPYDYNSIQLDWTDLSSSTSLNGYYLYRSTSKSKWDYAHPFADVKGKVTYMDDSVSTGKTYYYKIRAYEKISDTLTLYSAMTSYVSTRTAPGAPSNFKLSQEGKKITVSWDRTDGAAGYEVYRATSSGGKYSLLKTTTALSYTNTGLTLGKTYYYKVRAYAKLGSTKVYGAYSTVKSNKNVVKLYSFTDEVPRMLDKYLKLHPELDYSLDTTIIATTDNLYQPALDYALKDSSGGPDIYCAESSFVLKYTKGDMSSNAIPYENLGIDVNAEITAADIAQYTVDIGTRPSDKKVVGLGYQATGGAFIYRRSIAKDVWGTDDPAAIAVKIGPGWDKFYAAAAELKAKGYAIVSGDGDVWHAVENSSDYGWLKDGKLYIDPKREAFLDYSKQLTDNGYSNGTNEWSEAWYADMSGVGALPVFGFFGPAWMINYVMAGNCGATYDDEGNMVEKGTYGDWAVCNPTVGFFWGGTWVLANQKLSSDASKKAVVKGMIDWITLQCDNKSLQYYWATGTLNGPGGTKDTVASGTVMDMSDGTLDFLGGQNMFDVYTPANEFANGKNLTQYDEQINQIWRDQVRQYVAGNVTRSEAIANFKQAVKDQLDIDAAE